MKGLLYKDWCQIKAYGRPILFSVLIMIIASLLGMEDGASVFQLWGFFILGNLPTTLMAYDSNSRWITYESVLPLSRMQFVSEKYLVTLLVAVSGAGAVGTIGIAAWVAGVKVTLAQVGAMAVQGVEVIWISNALMLPIYYRFGAEKARYVYLGVIGMFGAVVGALMALGTVEETGQNLVNMEWQIQVLTFVVVAALSVLSWRLSIKWYGMAERNK